MARAGMCLFCTLRENLHHASKKYGTLAGCQTSPASDGDRSCDKAIDENALRFFAFGVCHVGLPFNYTKEEELVRRTTLTPNQDESPHDDKEEEQQQQLYYCHSPSTRKTPAWKKDVKAFVQSGHAEEYDGLCWCE